MEGGEGNEIFKQRRGTEAEFKGKEKATGKEGGRSNLVHTPLR